MDVKTLLMLCGLGCSAVMAGCASNAAPGAGEYGPGERTTVVRSMYVCGIQATNPRRNALILGGKDYTPIAETVLGFMSPVLGGKELLSGHGKNGTTLVNSGSCLSLETRNSLDRLQRSDYLVLRLISNDDAPIDLGSLQVLIGDIDMSPDGEVRRYGNGQSLAIPLAGVGPGIHDLLINVLDGKRREVLFKTQVVIRS